MEPGPIGWGTETSPPPGGKGIALCVTTQARLDGGISRAFCSPSQWSSRWWGVRNKAAAPAAETATQRREVVLASTTSTQDSGLFDVLIPAFEKANPEYKVKVIAVGTGEALKLGETKDADVLLVHAKADEEKFVANGFGKERKDVMYNDFIIVGPAADPAGVKAAADTTAAMSPSRRPARTARRSSSRVATTPAPTRRSSSSGRRPASSPRPRPRRTSGTCRPVRAWARRSRSPPRRPATRSSTARPTCR